MAYKYTNNISSTFEISSKTAKCTSIVVAISGKATKIVITQRLQKKTADGWTNIKSWTKSVNSIVASFSNSKSGLASGTYRTRTVAKVYCGSNYERVVKNSVTKTIQ